MSVRINELPTATSVSDNDSVVIDDGTTTQKINAKTFADAVAGDGKITIKQAGTTKGTFTVNQTGDTVIELTDENTTYSEATTSASGLMSKADKSKLDGIDTGANKTVVDDNLTSTSTTNALSANQGKQLESEISAVRGGTMVINGTTVTFTITES